MATLGERLAYERKRIGLNQKEFADLAGVTRSSQMNYETGRRSPDGEYLAAIAQAGADVQYILTGVHTMNLAQVLNTGQQQSAEAANDAIQRAAEERAEYTQKQQEEIATEAGALSPRDRIWLEIGQGLSDEDRTRLQEIGAALVSARELKDKAKDK